MNDESEPTGPDVFAAAGGEHEELPPQPGYAEAMAELEDILAELEGETVDVDRLGARVRRASVLISLCRERITAARMEIDHIVAELDQLDPADDRI